MKYLCGPNDADRRELSNPSWIDIEMAIRQLNGIERTLVLFGSGTPVPHMAIGRVCLTGDAAFVPRPHTAASTAKAAANALALANSLEGSEADVELALRRWEPDQIELGRRLRVYGQRLGDRSQFGR